jgi:hypothetical protein
MKKFQSNLFSFSTLDKLSFAAKRGRLLPIPDKFYQISQLGPVLDLARLSTSGLLPSPSRANWLDLDVLSAFGAALSQGRRSWTSPEGLIGFLRLSPMKPDDETEEIAFKLHAQQAASTVGFSPRVAAQLIGAFEEIQGNVYDHSGAPASGLATFLATARKFEFVVSDAGMGVLNSLRTCDDFAHLNDHADALRLMLMDGVTRCGKNSGHGAGFRPLFQGLANLNGELRFRTGDQALLINGINPEIIPAITMEKVPMSGFIASVICSL